MHNNWFIFDMPCPEGKRYDAEQADCVLAAEDEKCYYSSPGATGETLNTQIVLQC